MFSFASSQLFKHCTRSSSAIVHSSLELRAIKQFGLTSQPLGTFCTGNSPTSRQSRIFELNRVYTFQSGGKDNLLAWLTDRHSYANPTSQNIPKVAYERLTNNFSRERPDIAIDEAINSYMSIIIADKFIHHYSMENDEMDQFTKELADSKTDEEVLLVIFLKALNILRGDSSRKRFFGKILNPLIFFKQCQHVCHKFGFLRIIDATTRIDRKLRFCTLLIKFIYDIHSQKLNRLIKMNQLYDVYDDLLTISSNANISPDLAFSYIQFD